MGGNVVQKGTDQTEEGKRLLKQEEVQRHETGWRQRQEKTESQPYLEGQTNWDTVKNL